MQVLCEHSSTICREDFQLKFKKKINFLGSWGIPEGRRKNCKLKKQQTNGTFWQIDDILLPTKHDIFKYAY